MMDRNWKVGPTRWMDMCEMDKERKVIKDCNPEKWKD